MRHIIGLLLALAVAGGFAVASQARLGRRVVHWTRRLNVAIVGVVVIGALASVALGSAGLGFAPTNLVTASIADKIKANHDGVKLQTQGPTDVRVQKIDIAPGGYSGWHHHPGIVIVSVASGAVTFFSQSDCSSKTYGPGLPDGSAFVESHNDPGQASSAGGATVYATFVAPHAVPPVFRTEDAVQPPCVPGADGGDGSGDSEHSGGGHH